MNENNNTKQMFEAGIVAFAGNDFEKSVELFTRVIEADEHNALAAVSRGAAYLKQELLDQAWSDFDRAIKIDPGYARAHHMRGLASEKRGDDLDALPDFDRAIALNPEYGAAYYSRATLHAKLNDTDSAQEDIEMVTHLGSRNMASYMNENNVWQTQLMRVEDAIETELQR